MMFHREQWARVATCRLDRSTSRLVKEDGRPLKSSFFFFNDPATTEISPLPLHDALPIFLRLRRHRLGRGRVGGKDHRCRRCRLRAGRRSARRGRHLRRTELPRQKVQRQVDRRDQEEDRKSTRLNSSHSQIPYAVFCLKTKNITARQVPLSIHRPPAAHPGIAVRPTPATTRPCRARGGPAPTATAPATSSDLATPPLPP